MFMHYPVILHVPYCSRFIPQEIRDLIVLTDERIKAALRSVTDQYADELFFISGIDMITSPVSPMVVDMERLRDDKGATMAAAGRAAVNNLGPDGFRFGNAHPELREKYLGQYYDPYHAALAKQVESCLNLHGRCLIVNCHAISPQALSGEEKQQRPCPDICLGSCSYHTPGDLLDFARQQFAASYAVDINYPSAGSFVPGKYFLADKKVTSITIEVNKSLYLDETNQHKSISYDRTKEKVNTIMMDIIKQSRVLSRRSEILEQRQDAQSSRVTCVRCSMGKLGRNC